jgi:PAS domain S-box-containing protein
MPTARAVQGIHLVVKSINFMNPSPSLRNIRFEANVFGEPSLRTGKKDHAEGLTMDKERIAEHHRTDAALRESEARWRTLVDTAPDAIVSIDRSGIMTTCNEAALRMFGYAREEMLGRNVSLLMPSPHREAHDHYLDQYHSTGVRKVIGFWREVSGRRKDGEEFPLEVSVSETQVGGQHSFTGILRDLTERKRVEARLKEQAHLHSFCARIGKHLIESRDLADMLRGCTQTMVDDLGAAFARIWILNEQDNVLELQASSGLYTHVNGRHARIPLGSLKIGRIAAERRPTLTNHVIGDPCVPEQEWARREGMVAFAGYPLIIDDHVVAVMGMFSRKALSESTLNAMAVVADQIALGIQRKRAEQALIASEGKFRYVFETAGVCIFEEDWSAIRDLFHDLRAQGVMDLRAHLDRHPHLVTDAIPLVKITDVNDYTLQLFKAPSKAVLLGSLDRVFVPETARIFKEELIAVWDNRNLYRDQAPVRTMTGEDLTVSFSLVIPKRDTDWKRIMVTLTDITDLSLTEAALRESEERLRSFSCQLEQLVEERTAELRQSQDRLRGLATELNLTEQRERKRLAVELHDHLQQMLVLGRIKLGHGKRLVESIPDCAKMIGETDALLSEALTYTRTLVAELSPTVLRDHGLPMGLKWLGEYMQKHDMTVTVTVMEEPLTLPDDQALLLFQSVRELLMNAWKHAQTATAEITMNTEDGRLRIEVRDHGQGFNVSAAETHRATGLAAKFGLFSIHERMKALGGSFTIESAPRQGTTAKLTLPLRAPSQAAKDVLPSQVALEVSGTHRAWPLPDGGAKAHVRVLLVDDHAMMRQGLRTMLESSPDVQVVGEACNGEEALASVERVRPTVVVMDINMPKLNGIEATARLKSRYPDLIIIGLSVNAEEENQEAMKRAGASRLITKEAAVEQLYAVIQEISCKNANVYQASGKTNG